MLDTFRNWEGESFPHMHISISRLLTTRSQKFTLNWRDSDRACQLAGYVYIDGVPCGGNTIPSGVYGFPVTVKKSSIPTSTMSEKPFIFSRLELTGICSSLSSDHASTPDAADLPQTTIRCWTATESRVNLAKFPLRSGESLWCPLCLRMGYIFQRRRKSTKNQKKLLRTVSSEGLVIISCMLQLTAYVDLAMRFLHHRRNFQKW